MNIHFGVREPDFTTHKAKTLKINKPFITTHIRHEKAHWEIIPHLFNLELPQDI
ncbi:protein of unknown function [Legionella longbeachae NSW150]|uniref:Uncharacterized protein n=1 Tax=Legionella longbeachae serogroup 1 (strain NSW150) TaxID=661367 RepID=D3HIU0_LEGLN|nr:hypothetical protein LLB_3496 [Legionella longbeachae D-4968]CBJ12319.1 protein of unknown function [Legionella longbeachae NSW150]